MNVSPISGTLSERERRFPSNRPEGSFEEVLNAAQKNLEFERQRLRKAAHDLEASLIYQMIKAMRATVRREDNPLYGGQAEKIFQEMLDHEYSELISNSSNMGLATQIYNQMIKHVR